MKRVSSSTSIRAKRIHSNFVERNRIVINKATGVDPVDPIRPVKNETSYSSANYLMASDQFYDKLEKLKREYLNFYHSERNLKQAIDEIESDSDIDFKHIKKLIERYNKTIIALESFDKHIGFENVSNIKRILLEYSVHLNKIGISIVRDKELSIDENTFKDALLYSKDDLKPLLSPIRQFIVRLYRGFINIREEHPENSSHSYDNEYVDKSGMIIDSNG